MIKEIDLGGATRLEEVDDPFGLGCMVKPLARFGLEHVGEGDPAQPPPETLQEASSVKPEGGFESCAFGWMFHFNWRSYRLEMLASKFMRAETKVVTAARWIGSSV